MLTYAEVLAVLMFADPNATSLADSGILALSEDYSVSAARVTS